MTTATAERADQLEADLLDEKVLATLMGPTGVIDPSKLGAFVKSYAVKAMAEDDGLGKQISAGLKDGLKDFFKGAGYDRPPMGDDEIDHIANAKSHIYAGLEMTRAQKRQTAATGRGPAVPLAGKWDSFAAYLQDVQAVKTGGTPKVSNLLSEGVGADGGLLIPEEFRAELQMISLEGAVVRPRARVIPMGGPSLRIPVVRDASHASTVYGGVSGSWAPESGDISTVTQPTFTQVLLMARKLTGYTMATNELLKDSAISLEALLLTMFGQALGFFEDDAFLSGTGAGQPLGILNADAMVSVSKEVGQPAATINYQNIVKMYSRMLPSSLNSAVWYCHPDTFPELAQMALSVGTGGSAVWISNIEGGPPGTIFGRPIIITEKAQTTGTAGDIVFADIGNYLIGDRQSLQMATSEHVRFTTDQMVWRFIQRVEGRPWMQVALTPRHGSNTLSPFVSLATRS